MSVLDLLLGRRLASSEQKDCKIGVFAGIPALGLDATSSSAYGPEAALVILLPLGSAGLWQIGPITIAILALLTMLYFSYRQTIAAYPVNGGSYTVSKENLGINFGLLAAASLLLDYILTVAVGISAGVAALVSALSRASLLHARSVLDDFVADHARQPARDERSRFGILGADVHVPRQSGERLVLGTG